jgi:uncharacterized protein
MSGAPVSPTRVDPDQAQISVGQAAVVWTGAWIVGVVVGVVVVGLADNGSGADAPVWVTLVSALALWAPMLVGLWLLSKRFGPGRFLDDYGLRFKVVDLVGLPVGVLSQLVLVRLAYWPLQRAWPQTFSKDKVERVARDLYHNAHGGWLLGLIGIVVIGAPVVEELTYRGLLQGAVVRRVNDVVGVVLIAAFFALIHFQWVQYPGLFLFGLVLGICALRTGRLGMGIAAHLAFNATGLLLVAWA